MHGPCPRQPICFPSALVWIRQGALNPVTLIFTGSDDRLPWVLTEDERFETGGRRTSKDMCATHGVGASLVVDATRPDPLPRQLRLCIDQMREATGDAEDMLLQIEVDTQKEQSKLLHV